MPSIEKLLTRKGPKPTEGQLPEISAWTPIHTLEIKGGALQFTEARVLGLRGNKEHECYEIAVPNGKYSVECRVARYGFDARVARLRAIPVGTKSDKLARGKRIKDLPVDFGGIAVVDIGAVHASMQEDQERHEEWLDETLYGDSDDMVRTYTWKPTKTKIPVVDSGFGDGAYALYPLKAGAKAIGLEVEFIAEDEAYPM